MSHINRVSLTIIMVSIVAMACALPVVTLEDSNVVGTAVAQTVVAGFVQTALSQTLQPTHRTNAHLHP
jgi:hypothetical protein